MNNKQVIIVTGASAGIGEAIARRLSGPNTQLVLAARRKDRLEALRETLLSKGDVLVCPTDMRDTKQVLALFERTEAVFGRLDVLVNNAGLGKSASLIDGSVASWREMFDVNVLGLSYATQLGLKLMHKDNTRGHIIHISSMSGHRVPTGTGGMYAATKHAVKALTEALRRELHAINSPVRVCSISPGFVETEFAQIMSGSAEVAAETYGRFPCLQPDDIADAVQWVLRTPQHMQVHDILLRPKAQPS